MGISINTELQMGAIMSVFMQLDLEPAIFSLHRVRMFSILISEKQAHRMQRPCVASRRCMVFDRTLDFSLIACNVRFFSFTLGANSQIQC